MINQTTPRKLYLSISLLETKMFNKLFNKNKENADDVFFEKVMERYRKNEKVDDYILDMFKNENKETLNNRYTKAIKHVEKEVEIKIFFNGVK